MGVEKTYYSQIVRLPTQDGLSTRETVWNCGVEGLKLDDKTIENGGPWVKIVTKDGHKPTIEEVRAEQATKLRRPQSVYWIPPKDGEDARYGTFAESRARRESEERDRKPGGFGQW